MADSIPALSSAVTEWERTVENVRIAQESHLQARAEESRAGCALSNALEAEKKAFAAIVALRPKAKP